MHRDPFFEIAAILGMGTLLGIAGQRLRQPLLIMFLLTGILAGPACFGLIESYAQIELLAHIGIAILLFIVGLKLDLGLIRTTGPVALATGLGQIIFTSVIGFGIALGLGMSMISAAYTAVALTFSSTIIVVKLLSDKKEIDSLHGQIAVGFLIVQDIAAIVALVGLTTLGSAMAEDSPGFVQPLVIVVKGVGFVGAVALLMRYVLPRLMRHLAHSQEMLILFAIAWAVLLSAAGQLLGFSKEVGAFLAGVALASTPYRDLIGARLTSIRDFLLLFFFIGLGARLDLSEAGSQLGASILLSLFVLIGNPLIVLIIMGVMGYRRRTGFLAGLTVAQISEFSLIVAALGQSLGHINQETMGIITLVGVVTICVSTYMILYSDELYRLLERPLRVFERKNPYREAVLGRVDAGRPTDVILIGLGTYGSGVAEYLLRRGKVILGVDFDPGALEKWQPRGVSVLYGDVADPEIYEQLPLGSSRWVVSTVRSREASLVLLEHLRRRGYAGKVCLTATDPREAQDYESAGAALVFRPFADAAEQAADALMYAIDFLPSDITWPIAFREVRIRPDSAVAGKSIRSIPLRSLTGVSILAVSRSGAIHYDPEPEFQLVPGDQLLIMGSVESLRQAETLLREFQTGAAAGEKPADFAVAEIRIAEDSPLAGQTLAEVRFRQKYGVTVAGMQREGNKIVTPAPAERLSAGDILLVIGGSKSVETMLEKESV